MFESLISDAGLSKVIKKIITLLNDSGVLIAVERLSKFNDYVSFINTFQESGSMIILTLPADFPRMQKNKISGFDTLTGSPNTTVAGGPIPKCWMAR